jgi:hypothetical protein
MMNAEALSVVLSPVLTGLEQNLKDMPVWNKKNVGAKLDQMGQLVLTNSKWSGIWTFLISEGCTLLESWNNSFMKVEFNSSHMSTQPLLSGLKVPQNRELSGTNLCLPYKHNDEAKLASSLSDTTNNFNMVDPNSRKNIRRCSYEYRLSTKPLPCIVDQLSPTI